MCWAGVSRKLSCCLKTILFMNKGTEGSCGRSRHILRHSYPVRERSRENSQSICRGSEQFFLSTLRNKWSRASETEKKIRRGKAVCELLSILTSLLPHLGHIFFCCHLSWQWKMTQHHSGGFGRQSPGTYSPQAKLVQDVVHLLALPPRHSSSYPIYTVSKSSYILHLALGLLVSFLTLKRHISSSLAD